MLMLASMFCAFLSLIPVGGPVRLHAAPPIRVEWSPPPVMAPIEVAVPAPPTRPAAAVPRRAVVTLALSLRHVRYRFGGHDPATGLDCSGLVSYVFRRALGLQLPHSVWRQFRMGLRVARTHLQAGDLVFFRTHGRRVSHVGLYLGGGLFLHAPAPGQHVRVDRLDAHYWAHRYAGARRLAAAPRMVVLQHLPRI